MSSIARLGDIAKGAGSHGKKCCPHSYSGPAVSGSPSVFANGKPVLRIGDSGVHSSCCGANKWNALSGSSTVFANGIPVSRLGDKSKHCCSVGTIITGSPTIYAG